MSMTSSNAKYSGTIRCVSIRAWETGWKPARVPFAQPQDKFDGFRCIHRRAVALRTRSTDGRASLVSGHLTASLEPGADHSRRSAALSAYPNQSDLLWLYGRERG